jgi:Ca2+-binding EF-hand superfamily protein
MSISPIFRNFRTPPRLIFSVTRSANPHSKEKRKMRKLVSQLLLALAAAALPQNLTADEPPKPARPNPESLFKRLDANKDGVVMADEIPTGMPERLKQLLLKADSNGDKEIRLEELLTAMKAHRPEDRPAKSPEGRPESLATRAEKRPEGPNPEVMFKRLDANKDGVITADEIPTGAPERLKRLLTRAVKDGDGKIKLDELKAAFKARRDPGRSGPRTDGRPSPERQSRSAPQRRGGAAGPATALQRSFQQGVRANLPELPDLKVLFDRFDTDKDGKLSFDEFKTGATKVHRYLAERADANPAWIGGFTGGRDAMPPEPWMAMRQTGWGPPVPPGARYGQFEPGSQRGAGPQSHGHAHGWQQGPAPMGWGGWQSDRGPQHYRHAHGWPPQPRPAFGGYAHGWQRGGPPMRGVDRGDWAGHGPQFRGYAGGWYPGAGPQSYGPRPGNGPQFRGNAMNQRPGRGQQFHGGEGMGRGPRPQWSGPQGSNRPPRDRDGGGPRRERPEPENE